MKKLLLIVVILIGFDTPQLIAQEFKLPVIISSNAIVRQDTVTFGFDMNASDSMTDTQWKESTFPAFYNPGDLEVRMTSRILKRNYLVTADSGIGDDGGHIDIRRKPAQDSFILQYEMYNTKWDEQVPGTVSMRWDNTAIPPIIKHIYLAPEEDHRVLVRLDMKTSSHFEIPDSMLLYGTMLITVLYNRETMSVPQSNGVIDEMRIFPNPMDSHSTLSFSLKVDSRVNLSAYDITGKKVFDRIMNGYAGENEIAINKSDLSSHPGAYLLRLTGAQNGNAIQKSAMIIVE